MSYCTCELYGNCTVCREAHQGWCAQCGTYGHTDNDPHPQLCNHEKLDFFVSERMVYDVEDGVIDWDTGKFVDGGYDPVYRCQNCGIDVEGMTVPERMKV